MRRLRIDLDLPDGAPTRYLVRPGTTVADLLAAAGASTRSEPLVAAGTPVTPTMQVGRPPLLDGARLQPGVPDPPAGMELTVVAGPGVGRSARVGGRPVVVGRAHDVDLPLPDPSVSRRHAVVRLDRGAATVEDLGTTNGVDVGGSHVRSGAVDWPSDGTAQVGACTLALRVGASPAPAGHVVDGRVRVRTTRTRPPALPTTRLVRPAPPRDAEPRRLEPVVLLAPFAASAVVAGVLHSPLLLLLGLTGPVVVLATHLANRRSGTRSRRRALREHATATTTFHQDLADAARAERAHRLAHTLDTARALDHHHLWGASRPVWCPGRGDTPAEHVCVQDEEPPVLTGVPIGIPLAPGDQVALLGADAAAAARALVVQLVTQLAPDRLHVAVLGDARTRQRTWAWADLLPHRRRTLDDPAALAATPAGGPLLLVVADDRTALPPMPAAVVVHVGVGGVQDPTHTLRLGTGGPVAAVLTTGGTVTHLVPDLLDLDLADRAARRLAPLEPPGDDGDREPPPSASLLDLVGEDVLTGGLAARWGARQRLGAVPVGVDGDGTVTLDLVADGPHALVGGTTGAGKSELVTTLVTALALTHSPEVVSVLIVDFKGGATGHRLAGLPHVCDVVTDLDPPTALRALTGLEAELKRRERLVAEAGAQHVDDVPGLARLLIVVDEYRVLAEEHPTFLAGLLRVATTGRSLGVHLLLATQRPAGIVSADVRANVSLRIALRLNDTHDSQDVVGSPDAARIPPSLPGRAVVRRVDGTLAEVQIARAGAPAAADEPDVVPAGRTTTSRTGDVLDALVTACAATAADLGCAVPRSPVPPPLAELVDAAALGHDGAGLPIGVVDLPHEQRQTVLVHDPAADGHLAVVGVPRSGRTTTARTLVHAALASADGPDVHAVGPPELTAGLTSPRLGTVIAPTETRLVHRLLDRVRTGSGRPTLVVVDGWPAVTAAVDPLTALRLHEGLVRLLSEGPGRSVHVVLTGDRTLLTGSIAAHLTSRLVLRLADPVDLALAGLAPALAAAWTRPGRALRARDGATVQLAEAPAALHRPGAAPVDLPRLRPLPTTTTTSPGEGVVAAGGDDASPVALDPTALRTFLAVGAERTGRTTALATVAAAATRPQVWVARGDIEGADAVVDPSTEDAPTALRTALERHPEATVVVDELVDVADGPLDATLVALAESRRHPVLVGARTPEVAGAYRGLGGLLRRNRTGVVLCPGGPADGEVLGVRLDGVDRPLPGRGVLVTGGRQVVVQMATLRDDTAPTDSSAAPARGTMGR